MNRGSQPERPQTPQAAPHSEQSNTGEDSSRPKKAKNKARLSGRRRGWKGPAGLFQQPEVEQSAANALTAACGVLKGETKIDKDVLYTGLKAIADTYWSLHRAFEEPSSNTQRTLLRNIAKGAKELQEKINDLGPSESFFLRSVLVGDGMLLNGFGNPTSVVDTLQQLEKACLKSMPPKEKQGARKKSHIARAAAQCVQLWQSVSGRPFKRTFDSEPNRRFTALFASEDPEMKGFISAGPRFTQNVLLGIDP